MSLDLETSTTIDRPVEVVFEYVTAVEHNADWEPRMVRCPPPDEAMGVGTTWHPEIEGIRGTEHTTMECIVYDPPTKFGYTTPDEMLGGRLKTEEALYTYSAVGETTQVTWSGTIRVTRLFTVVGIGTAGAIIVTFLWAIVAGTWILRTSHLK